MGNASCKGFTCNDTLYLDNSCHLTPRGDAIPNDTKIKLGDMSNVSSAPCTHRKSEPVMVAQIEDFRNRLSVVEDEIAKKSHAIDNLNRER
jgi:hypothetical protein